MGLGDLDDRFTDALSAHGKLVKVRTNAGDTEVRAAIRTEATDSRLNAQSSSRVARYRITLLDSLAVRRNDCVVDGSVVYTLDELAQVSGGLATWIARTSA